MRYRALFPFVLLALFVSVASGQGFSTSQPPFSSSPQALREAFSGIEPGKHSVLVLLEDGRYEFDAEGRQTVHYRTIFKALTRAGAENWAMIERTWAPWQEERPTIRARVIARDGTVHELDPKTIADAPATDHDDDVLTDRRKVRAPLPAMEPDSIVEQEIVVRQTVVPLDAGTVRYFQFGSGVPVQRTIVRIKGPQEIPFRFKTRLLPDVVVSDKTEAGIREITFDQGPMKPLEDAPPLLPSEEPRSPHIVFSTGPNWNTVARAYSEVIRKQSSGFDASRYLPKMPAGATREAKILAIVNLLNKDIRYTGIEFSESALVPHKPADVLAQRYGDCKDKATLAVALLRSAGIEAYVALLLSSTGEDVEPTLPGIDAFNHAIVYVAGEHGLWLDPTDPFLRLGTVSAENQGRYALIARPETTELMRTPALTAEDNRIVEKREFQLSELGRAHVIETGEVNGTPDRDYRMSFLDKDKSALRDTLKDYIEWTYGETRSQSIGASDASDLSNPYQLKIELTEAQRGTTGRTEAAVAIRISQLTARLPQFFRTDPKDKADKDKANKDETPKQPSPRTADFEIYEPFTYEWHYSIQAPAGFKIRQLPEAQNEKLGLATLTARFVSDNPTSVSADFRFVMPKRRFSAEEGLALRDAVVELNNRKMMLIYFDQVGETDLASGKVREALTEFAALRKLHPNEPLHAMQTARAMLAAGAGESARAEARRAVALEPTSSKAYLQLAEVLKNDLVGRSMKKGYDRDGAVAAYRKALDLDPKDDESRANLAILLEYDLDGIRYGAGAKLDEAIAEYAKVLDKLAGFGLTNNYAIALFRAGRNAELEAYLAKQPENETNQALRVCAQTILHGAAAGIQRAAEISGVAAKQRVLASAGQTLLTARRYDLAADIFSAIADGAPNPTAIENLIQVLKKTKRFEEMPEAIREPEDAIRALMLRVWTPEKHETDWIEIFSPFLINGEKLENTKSLLQALAREKAKARGSGLTSEAAIDIGLSAIQFSRDGSDDTGWVIRMTIPGGDTAAADPHQVWYVVRERDTYRILQASGDFSGVARLVQSLLEQGKLEQAKIWLDRVRPELSTGTGDDPLSGSMFSRVWQSGQAPDANRIRVAAGLLLSDKPKGIGSVIETLEAASKSADARDSDAVSASLAEAYFTDKQYGKALAVSEDLLRKLPGSTSALQLALRAAYGAGGEKEAGRIIATHLSRFKDNVAAMRAVATTAMVFGDTERSTAIEKQILDSGRGQPSDYNQVAWADLMAGKATNATLEVAKKGLLLGSNGSTGLLHTLAAVEAELDKTTEARAALLQRITALGEDEPDDDDWYVFGRIAQSYGLNQDAAAMYRRLDRPTDERAIPASSYALAQKQLKLTAGK